MSVWVTLTEYASLRGVNRRTARRWVREGRVPARRTRGGHWRVDISREPLRVTVSEAALMTGKSDRTIRAMCGSGRLVAQQTGPGCEWLIPASELDRLAPVENEGGSR